MIYMVCEYKPWVIIPDSVVLKYNNRTDVDETAQISNRQIYAFAYRKERNGGADLYCKPVKGEIKNGMFYEYKKDGTLKKSSVSIFARCYADTTEEAIQGYNYLISEKIYRLIKEAESLSTMLINLSF